VAKSGHERITDGSMPDRATLASTLMYLLPHQRLLRKLTSASVRAVAVRRKAGVGVIPKHANMHLDAEVLSAVQKHRARWRRRLVAMHPTLDGNKACNGSSHARGRKSRRKMNGGSSVGETQRSLKFDRGVIGS